MNSEFDKVFRGPSPTTLELLAIASVFETNTKDFIQHDGNTGYQLMSSGQISKGSQYSYQDFQFRANLNVQITFILSDNTLITDWSVKVAPIMPISAILGLVFVIMGTIRSLMGHVESKKLDIESKINLKKKRNSEILCLFNSIYLRKSFLESRITNNMRKRKSQKNQKTKIR